jgi:hypothetical protein
LSILGDIYKSDLIIKKPNQINFKSKADTNKLYNLFGKNRCTIAFWVNTNIFPIYMQYYEKSICSSAFDLANVPQLIGFSGTIDNQWVMPKKVLLKSCKEESIQSTNGKMIHMILDHTEKNICEIP